MITNGTLTRSRETGGSIVALRWQTGTVVEESVEADVQADIGATTRAAASGDRTSYFVKFVVPPGFTMRGADQFGESAADTFTHTAYPGITFRVLTVQDYSAYADIMPDTAHVGGTACRVDEASTKNPDQTAPEEP